MIKKHESNIIYDFTTSFCNLFAYCRHVRILLSYTTLPKKLSRFLQRVLKSKSLIQVNLFPRHELDECSEVFGRSYPIKIQREGGGGGIGNPCCSAVPSQLPSTSMLQVTAPHQSSPCMRALMARGSDKRTPSLMCRVPKWVPIVFFLQQNNYSQISFRLISRLIRIS